MKKWLTASLFALGVAMALFVTNLGQHHPATSSIAEAAANFVTVVDQKCLAGNDLGIDLNWAGYNEGSQWVDLSLANNDFFPGTFAGIGPLAANQTAVTWDGILPGLTHYLRINTLTSTGWSASPTIVFTTRNDCQFASQTPVGASSVSVVDQQCIGPNEVKVSLLWNRQSEGSQWVDLSLANNGFFPGSFAGIGPLASNQSTVTWNGILAGLTHYLRINTLTAAGWAASPTIAFTTRNDCRFVVQGAGARDLDIDQVCMLNGTPRVQVTWNSSDQGEQWLDSSTENARFEPYTFTFKGPFDSDETSYDWDGLVAGSVHYVRINTGTQYGWISSPASTFTVRSDCRAATPTAVPATATPVPTATAAPVS